MVLVLLIGCATERDRGGEPSGGVHRALHGDELRDHDWDFSLCQSCHGDDFAGGTSGVSCLDCHDDGPTSCDTCHDETSGAHPAHLAIAGVPCGECHQVPETWDAEGHILIAGQRDESPAEVVLGALSARDVVPPRRIEPPRYDATTQTCSSVYCHGGTLGDTAAFAPVPRWQQPGAAACGGCHGEPPDDHASERCTSCHRGAPHLDGVLDVGIRSGCSGCHGDDDSPAPPVGLGGETSPQVYAVGAHRSHLDAPGGVRGPIACAECHTVPATLDAPGHIDSAEPAEAQCDSYCHGDASPVWNQVGVGAASCGTCHGLPPLDADHGADLPLSSCTTCHPSVDGFGAIVFTGADTTEHLDGDVDVQ